MADITITGGAGFIGSHLCRALLKKKHNVLCVDNLFTGNRKNIIDLLDDHGFEFIRHDITKPLYIETDQIYNLACPASPVHYQFDPVQTLKTCVHGSINMLALASRIKAKIFQASTSEVYGDPEIHPQSEEYHGRVNIIGPRSCYDEGKRCAETLFFDYHRSVGLNICVARIFNTYGPNMLINDGRVVSNFIIQSLLGMPITVHGDGKQTRSFCYVDDLIDAIIKLMESDVKIQPYNVGNPREISILELITLVSEIVGNKSEIKFLNAKQDDPIKRCPDISRIKSTIDWEPKTSLEDGLKNTVKYFEKVLQDDENLKLAKSLFVG